MFLFASMTSHGSTKLYGQHKEIKANMLGSHVDMGLHWNLTALINSILVYIYINQYVFTHFIIKTGSVYWLILLLYCFYAVVFHFYIAEWYLCSSYWYHQSIYLYYQQIEIAGPWDLEWWSAGARRVFPTASLLQCLITTWRLLSGKRLGNYGKSPCLRGKSTISMTMFNSKLLVYQRLVQHINKIIINPFRTNWLVVWNIFPFIGNVIIPTDELIFFSGVGQPPTSYTIPMVYKL